MDDGKVNDTNVVAIRFNKVFPEFKEYAQRTTYRGDLLDKESYVRLFKECGYIVSSSHPVDFDGKKRRCLCVDVEKAVEVGIDLEGSWVTDVTAQVQVECNQECRKTKGLKEKKECYTCYAVLEIPFC